MQSSMIYFSNCTWKNTKMLSLTPYWKPHRCSFHPSSDCLLPAEAQRITPFSRQAKNRSMYEPPAGHKINFASEGPSVTDQFLTGGGSSSAWKVAAFLPFSSLVQAGCARTALRLWQCQKWIWGCLFSGLRPQWLTTRPLKTRQMVGPHLECHSPWHVGK